MPEKCKLCGKELTEDADSLYCYQCDEMLDKRFDKIEEDILVYKDLTEEEVDILKNFDSRDIVDLYVSTYLKFSQEGQITQKEKKVLEKLKDTFNLSENQIEKEMEIAKKIGTEICPECRKPISENFNLCPYCAYKLNPDFENKIQDKPDLSNYQNAMAPMLKNPGCLIIAVLVLVAIIVYFIYRIINN